MQNLIATWLICAQKLGYLNTQQIEAIQKSPTSNIYSSYLSQKQILLMRLVAIEWILAQKAYGLKLLDIQNFQLQQMQKIEHCKQTQTYPFTLIGDHGLSQEQFNQVLKNIDKTLLQEYQTLQSYFHQESKSRLQTQQMPQIKRPTPREQEKQSIKPFESVSPSQIFEQEQNDLENLLESQEKTYIPKTIGRYKIIKELGQGGMGKVYQAFDPKLNRDIALKVIIAGAHASEQMIKRFKQEAEATAAIKHPNIVGVYDIDQEGQTYYFTMDFIKGDTLGDYLKKSKLSYRKLAALMKKIALALSEAHRHGIIHRDLKPANIMMNAKKEPKVMDFGLAKLTEGNEELSKTGSIMGTPAYMPPEQAKGKAKQMDARGDVYSLGAILYVMLTGRPPFQGEEAMKILMQVINDEPIALRYLNPDIPIELEAICLKCLEKNVALRYQTSKAFATDLQNFIDHKPILAKPANKITYFKKWVLRNKVLSGSIVIVFFSLVVAIVFLLDKVKIETKLKEKEKQARKEKEGLNKNLTKKTEALAKRTEDLKSANKNLEGLNVTLGEKQTILTNALYYSNLTLLQKHIEQGEIAEARRILKLEKEKTIKKKMKWEWKWLKQQTQQELKSIALQEEEIEHSAFSPDGKILAILSINKLVFYNTIGGNPRVFCTAEVNTSFRTFAFSRDNRTIVTGHYKEGDPKINTMTFWDIATKAKLKTLVHPSEGKILWCTFSPHKKYLACTYERSDDKGAVLYGRSNKTFILWDIKSGKKKIAETIHSGHRSNNVNFCDFHPQGKWVVIGGQGGGSENYLVLLDIKKNIQRELKGHKKSVLCCRFSPDGKWIASVDGNGMLIIWDFKSKKKIYQREVDAFEARHCEFSLDSQTVVIASGTKSTMWDVKTGKKLRSFYGHTQDVLFALICPDGKSLTSIGKDYNLKFWHLNLPWLQTISREIKVDDCTVSSDGKTIAIAYNYNKIRLYDIETRKERDLKKTASAKSCDFNNQGNQIVVCNRISQTTTVDTQNGQIILRLEGGSMELRAYARDIDTAVFNHNGTKIAGSSEQSCIIIWDVNVQGRKRPKMFSFSRGLGRHRKIKGHWHRIHQVIFSSDGTKIISPDPNNNLANYAHYGMQDKRVDRAFQEMWNRKYPLGIIRIWNANSNKRFNTPISQISIPNKVAQYTPLKSKRFFRNTCCAINKTDTLLLSNSGNILMLWDFAKKKLIGLFIGHIAAITHCAFFEESERIVSVDEHGKMKIWERDAYSKEYDQELGCKIIRRPLLNIDAHAKKIVALAISKDNRIIVTGGEDKKVKIWRIVDK